MSDYILEITQVIDREIATLEGQIGFLRGKRAVIISLLQGDDKTGASTMPPKATASPTIPSTPARVGKTMTVHERLLVALDKMPVSGFETSDLLSAINSDGNGGVVNRNSTLKIFKALISNGTVDVVTPWSGKRGGVYKKSINTPKSHDEQTHQNNEPTLPALHEQVEQKGEQEHTLF